MAGNGQKKKSPLFFQIYSLFLFNVGRSDSVINNIQRGLRFNIYSGGFVTSGAPEDSEAGGR